MVLHTLQIEHAWLLLVYTLLTLLNARLQKGMRGVKLFVVYNALALVGAVAVLSRGSIPDLLSIVVGNVCVISGYSALYGSMHCLFGFSRRQHVLAGIWLVLGIVSMVWLGSLHPDTGARLFLYSAVLALQQLHMAALLVFGSRERSHLGWMPGMLLIALGIANIARMAIVAVEGAPADYRASGPALAAIVLANACLQCGLMVSYVWMTAAQLRRDLELQATTDPLTGLLNRRALAAAAQQQVRAVYGVTTFSAILLDLDSFKPINDRLGHAAGDRALVAVAQCFSQKLRPCDRMARTGGDEFMILLPGASAEQARVTAERLRGLLETLPLGLSEGDVRVTGSFGVGEAIRGESWDSLCQRCDRAMYAVKDRGGNAVHCYNAHQPASLQEIYPSYRETLA